jgi:tRNA (Thr-GGU) A37 N-methylase
MLAKSTTTKIRRYAIVSMVSFSQLLGQKVGLFSTRTPHRPNPIGMSVARLQRIDGCELHLTGMILVCFCAQSVEIDLLDGTPILDIKPYIPYFDSFPNVTIPDWIHTAPKFASWHACYFFCAHQ